MSALESDAGSELAGEPGRPTVPNNLELTVRLHPVSGEDVSVISTDFYSEENAVDAVAHALNERRSLVLRRAKYNRETGEHGVVINLANVVMRGYRGQTAPTERRASTYSG